MVDVSQNPNIELYQFEVIKVDGYVGNFTAVQESPIYHLKSAVAVIVPSCIMANRIPHG